MKMTSEVKNRLRDIKNIYNCPIAEAFIYESSPINYLAINIDQPKKITYLDKKRIDKIPTSIIKIGDFFENNFLNISSINKSVVNNYFSIDKINKYYNKRLRYSSSPAKIIRKAFGDRFKQKQIDAFVSYWYGTNITVSKDQFILDSNVDYWYLSDNYYSLTGQLGESCMRYERCQKLFGIYNDNENIQIAVYHTDNQVLARSIIWDGKYFDRIYGVNNHIQMAFKKFLLKKYVEIYGKNLELDIKLKHVKYDDYPYMDTFKELHSWGLSTYDEGYKVLEDAHEYDNTCANCGDAMFEPSYVDDIGNCCNDCVAYCDKDDCYYLYSNVVWLENDECVLEEEACEIDGKYYLKTECKLVNDEYILKTN